MDIGSTVTAAKVGNLEGFINVCAGINGYSTITGNKTVNIHTAVNGNITVFFHFNKAVTAYRTSGIHLSTLCGFNNRRHAESAVYNNLGAACHCKCSVCCCCSCSFRRICRSSLYGFISVIRNKQRYAGRNCICSCGKCAVCCKNYCLCSTAYRCVNCICKAVIKCLTHSKVSFCGEYSLNIHIRLGEMSIICILRKNLIVCCIYPRDKLTTVICYCLKLDTFNRVH